VQQVKESEQHNKPARAVDPHLIGDQLTGGRRTIGLLIVVILGVRLAMVLAFLISGYWTTEGPTNTNWWTGTDGYVLLARTLTEAGQFSFSPNADPTLHRAPAFPLALAAVRPLVGSYVWATVAVNMVCSAITAVLSLLIARRFFSARWAWAFVLLTSLHPALVRYTSSSWSDVFLTTAFTCYVWCTLVAFERRKVGMMVASGLAFALTLLTKPILMPFPVVMLVVALCFKRNWIKPILVQSIVAALAVSPWVMRNYDLVGRPVLVAGGSFNILVGNYMVRYHGADCNASFHTAVKDALADMADHGPAFTTSDLRQGGHLDITPDQDKVFFQAAMRQYLDDPLLVVRKIGVNLMRFWYFAAGPVRCAILALINIPMALLAAWALWRLRDREDALWLALLVVYVCLIYSVIIVHSRFYFILIPFLGPLALGAVFNCRRPAADDGG
jgi:4-amino-4-deoxy-L-arabinose transferase-like glycosyltransferase